MSTPSKAQDPAAAALSAIEDALRLHVEPEATSAEATPGNEAKTETSPKLEFHLPTSRPEGRSQARHPPPSRRRRPACPMSPPMNSASARAKPTRRARF